MSMVQNKEIVRNYVEVVFGKGNFAAASQFLAPDFVDHNPFTTSLAVGPAGQAQVASMLHGAFADFHVPLEDLIAEGDRVAVRGTMSGTHRNEFLGIAPTEKRVSWQVMVFYRLANGKIVERWGTYDLMGLLKELGVAPEKLAPAGVR